MPDVLSNMSNSVCVEKYKIFVFKGRKFEERIVKIADCLSDSGRLSGWDTGEFYIPRPRGNF